MLLHFLLAIFTCCVLLLYVKWRRVSRYWLERGVPYEPPHLILGSLTFLQRVNPAIWFRDMYDRFKSPYVGMWLLWKPALMINSPEIARRVLVKDGENFRDRFLSSGKSDPIGGLNLFAVNEPTWSSIRRRLTPVFTSAKLKGLSSLIILKTGQLVQRLHREIEKGEPIDMRTLYSDFTTDIIGISAFGVSSEATLTGKSHMRDVTLEFMKFSVFRGLSWSSIFFFPYMVDIFRFTFFPKNAIGYLSRVFRAMASERENNSGVKKNDLLDALLQIKKTAKLENEHISEELLVAQAAIFVQGGFDTSATVLTFLTYELAYSPENQEKLYQELLTAKQNYQPEAFDEKVISDGLPYMNACIDEVLRRYSPMGWLDRIAANDYKIDDKLTIKAGTPVYVNSYGMQHDPQYYPDPYKFNPDRFLPENRENIPPFTFMPFGDGPRVCIGERFAYRVIRHAVASIFLNFKSRPLPNTPRPEDCAIEKKGLFLMPGAVMSVQYIPRASSLI